VVLGQGYLWMIYKTPGSVIWDLSQRSHQLWKMLAQSLEEEGLDPMVELGWKKCGIYLHLSIPAIWKGDMQIYLAEFEAAYKFCIIFKLG